MIATHESFIYVPVSRNWYKTVSNLYENLYVKFCMKIVDLKGSYSANTQPIWNNDFPGEPKKLKFAPIIVWI